MQTRQYSIAKLGLDIFLFVTPLYYKHHHLKKNYLWINAICQVHIVPFNIHLATGMHMCHVFIRQKKIYRPIKIHFEQWVLTGNAYLTTPSYCIRTPVNIFSQRQMFTVHGQVVENKDMYSFVIKDVISLAVDAELFIIMR